MALAAVAGCSSPPEIDVEHQWADTMRRLNMFAFYPMSEDVSVGDFYLHAPPADGSASAPRFSLARVGSFPRDAVMGELTRQQTKDRPRMQPLTRPDAVDGIARPGAVVNTANCGGYDIGHADEAGCPVRLQRAAIPNLSVGRITVGQLGAAGVYGNFGTRIGLGRSSETAIRISLRNVQDLSLDAWRLNLLHNNYADDVYQRVWVEVLFEVLGQLRPDMVGMACQGDARALANAGIEVLVMNRVIYAGGLEYAFTNNAETAVRLALDLQRVVSSTSPAVPAFAGGTGSGKVDSPPQTPPTTDNAAAGQRLAALMAGVTGESGGAGRLGVTANFGVGTFGSLSLKHDFNRPVAVGAGSRFRIPFHTALRGVGAHVQERIIRVKRYCSSVLGSRYDEAALMRTLGN
ncbi:hypothetical protein EAH89_18830 [Roseomonas nepalensis]|uniref:Uncharacterized protein n=1 Tax=Muricoccus nepalensis TaxID=1854500 RepID=A0A502FS72_9PROT|nr:hypothetical protein [Roseomonas nepalensis]TPG52294.1 hypothetical protein EAH89_18830 [Roseomonas nepalensis]